MAIAGTERGFIFISCSNPESIKSITEIQPGEELLASKAIEKSGDEGERIAVLDGYPIEGVVVNTET